MDLLISLCIFRGVAAPWELLLHKSQEILRYADSLDVMRTYISKEARKIKLINAESFGRPQIGKNY